MTEKSKLTPKQELFCVEYLKDLNATQAAIRAGYSEKTARNIASENLAKPDIQEFICSANKKRLDEVKIEASFVLGELHKIASSSIKDAVDENGILLPINEMPDHVAKTIQSIDIEEEHERDKDTNEINSTTKTIKIKFWSKDKSLENLGKHLKLFTEKIELSGDKENPVQVNQVDITDRIGSIKND